MSIVLPVAHPYSATDRLLIERAFALAQRAHQGQLRASGQPYLSHPTAVAEILVDMGMDAPTIAAAYLHDVIEDCGMTRIDLEREIGSEVASLVDGVTKLRAIRFKGGAVADPQTESLKKMFLAMADDPRVIFIKLADRLHNMRTLGFKHPESRVRKAQETIAIYAPIADRLGMGNLRGELEDLAFPHAYPTEYVWLKRTVKGKYEDRLRYLEHTTPIIKRHLQEAGIGVVDVHSRAKRMWSLYEKLQRYDTPDPDKVLDLVALRVIVPDMKTCYEALGVLHAHYKPVPGRVKDYIALPKPNGYQSLHTAVFCEKGRIVEVQIRTPQMHEHAERGVAAHWAYTDSGKHPVQVGSSELAWMKQLKDAARGVKGVEDMAGVRVDFFQNRIFALTPQGDVKDMPEGATPVDFAYAVHSELGHRTTGALVNGRIAPLTHRLQSGDVVEIQKGREARPNRNWLRFVKTTQAAKHIRSWFNQNQKVTSTATPAENPTHRVKKLRKVPSATIPSSAILIAHQQGLAYRLGRCCSPTPGAPIAGYLTVGRGITIHHVECANIKAADKRRLMEAQWSS